MIGRTIRDHRVARGWTQQGLAERLRTSASSVVKWEAGSVEPRLRQLQALAGAFGVTIDELVAGSVADETRPTGGGGASAPSAPSGGARAVATPAQFRAAAEADRRTIAGLDVLDRLVVP